MTASRYCNAMMGDPTVFGKKYGKFEDNAWQQRIEGIKTELREILYKENED